MVDVGFSLIVDSIHDFNRFACWSSVQVWTGIIHASSLGQKMPPTGKEHVGISTWFFVKITILDGSMVGDVSDR